MSEMLMCMIAYLTGCTVGIVVTLGIVKKEVRKLANEYTNQLELILERKWGGKPMSNRPIICVDFDGVIHSYENGWQDGEIYGTVVPGFFEWYLEAAKHFDIRIYSSRSRYPAMREAMGKWLMDQCGAWAADREKSMMAAFTFAHEKPPAFVTIDDRAICFKGDWNADELSIDALRAFKPWNVKRESDGGTE